MDPHEPDTPGSDPVQALQSKRTAGSRYGNQEYEPSENGHDRGNDQAVFDLSMDYSDDETLLDWEQYAGNRKTRCCGCDVSWLQRCLPCLPWVPPEWYYRICGDSSQDIPADAVRSPWSSCNDNHECFPAHA